MTFALFDCGFVFDHSLEVAEGRLPFESVYICSESNLLTTLSLISLERFRAKQKFILKQIISLVSFECWLAEATFALPSSKILEFALFIFVQKSNCHLNRINRW